MEFNFVCFQESMSQTIRVQEKYLVKKYYIHFAVWKERGRGKVNKIKLDLMRIGLVFLVGWINANEK